jgi:hypothetical protein
VPRFRVDAILCAFDRGEHRIEAILNVEVRLALMAVAEHAEPQRIAAQTFVEVEDVAVGITLPQDGHEAEDVSLHAKSFAVRGD